MLRTAMSHFARISHPWQRLRRLPFWGLIESSVHSELLAHRRGKIIATRVSWMVLLAQGLLGLVSLALLVCWPDTRTLPVCYVNLLGIVALRFIGAGLMDPDTPLAPLTGMACAWAVLVAIQGAGLIASGAAGAQFLQVTYLALPFLLLPCLALLPLTAGEGLSLAFGAILFSWLAALIGRALPPHVLLPIAGALALVAIGVAVAACAGLKLVWTLIEEGMRDGLTGCYTRKGGEALLALQCAHFKTTGEPFAVAFIDLDHFKAVNDDFGHEAGDTVLKAAATALRKGFRASDMVIRWGGEEFLVILPKASLAEASRAVTRVCSASLGLRPEGSELTASAGVAHVTEVPASALEVGERTVAVADYRVYQAKANGRNQIVANGLPDEAAIPPKIAKPGDA